MPVTPNAASPPAIVPGKTFFRVAQGPAETQDRRAQESEMFPDRVQMRFTRRGDERMLVQNDESFAGCAREPF